MNESTSFEHLRQQLDERNTTLPPIKRSGLTPPRHQANPGWSPMPPASSNLFSAKKVLLFSGLFFVLMALIAGFIFYSGGNVVSTGNIDIVIKGPAEVRAGEAVPLEFEVTNHNQQALQIAELILEYPTGTNFAPTAGINYEVVQGRQRIGLGELAGGDSIKRTVQPIFFGEKDSTLSVKGTLEYRLAGSNAIFSKQVNYQAAISAAPVMVKATLPEEANSGQTVNLKVEVLANTPAPLMGQSLVINYPPGWRFVSANPAPVSDDNVWSLDSVSADSKFTLTVTGVIEGQDNETKNFKISAGQLENRDDSQLAVVYGATSAELVVQKPQLQLTALINNDPETEVVADGRSNIQFDITWGNNLNEEVVDGQVTAVLTGAVVDETSVQANKGFYQSTTNSAIWNKATDPGLARLAPSVAEQATLRFGTVALSNAASQFKNPTIDVDLKFKAKRVSDGQWLESKVHKTIKLNSQVQFAAKALYYDAAAANTGPLPPKVGSETTYTINWALLNSSNDLEQVEVRAPVPPYMRWIGPLATTEHIEYVPSGTDGGTVIWHVGYVKAGVGLATAPREVSFKLGLTPSVSQVGQSPVLVSPATVSAQDTFTKAQLSLSPRQNITTDLTSDPRFQYGQQQVVQ